MAKISKVVHSCLNCEHRQIGSLERDYNNKLIINYYYCTKRGEHFGKRVRILQQYDGLYIDPGIPDWCPLEDYKEN